MLHCSIQIHLWYKKKKKKKDYYYFIVTPCTVPPPPDFLKRDCWNSWRKDLARPGHACDQLPTERGRWRSGGARGSPQPGFKLQAGIVVLVSFPLCLKGIKSSCAPPAPLHRRWTAAAGAVLSAAVELKLCVRFVRSELTCRQHTGCGSSPLTAFWWLSSAVDGVGAPHLICLWGRMEGIQRGTTSPFHRAARFVLPRVIKKELSFTIKTDLFWEAERPSPGVWTACGARPRKMLWSHEHNKDWALDYTGIIFTTLNHRQLESKWNQGTPPQACSDCGHSGEAWMLPSTGIDVEPLWEQPQGCAVSVSSLTAVFCLRFLALSRTGRLRAFLPGGAERKRCKHRITN